MLKLRKDEISPPLASGQFEIKRYSIPAPHLLQNKAVVQKFNVTNSHVNASLDRQTFTDSPNKTL